MPPSSEHPHAKAGGGGPSADSVSTGTSNAEANAKTKRRRGGQKGHPKRERTLIPVEQCDEIVSCRPAACRGCGTTLRKADDDPEPLRHQVWEIPQPEPIVTEYQRHRVTCPCCGLRVTAFAPVAGCPTESPNTPAAPG